VLGIEKLSKGRNKMKKQINKILVAIDFSSYSKPALEYAVEVSKMTKAQILIINVVNQKGTEAVKKDINSKKSDTFSMTKYLDGMTGRRRAKLQTLIKEVPELEGLKPKIIINYGIPHNEILISIDQEKADFLIFGPKGHTDFHGFLFGSVAEKLFRYSPVPVMSLRNNLKKK
jgi:nucleotide-binding universal stress UspA family protein